MSVSWGHQGTSGNPVSWRSDQVLKVLVAVALRIGQLSLHILFR
jgi:hypothetical protein